VKGGKGNEGGGGYKETVGEGERERWTKKGREGGVEKSGEAAEEIFHCKS